MQRRFPHRFQALARALFSSQLCQLLTTRPSLENRNKHYQKKGSLKAFGQSIYITRTSCSNFHSCYRSNTGLGGWAKDKSPRQSPLLPILSSKMNPRALVGVTGPFRGLLAETLPLSDFARARRRASCCRAHRFLVGPSANDAGYRDSTALHCGNLRRRRRPREKSAHSGENCILVYNAKAVPPPVSGSCQSLIFVPTLSAADNQAAHEVD